MDSAKSHFYDLIAVHLALINDAYMLDFAITLDSDVPLPLHRQLYEELRQAILNGRLLPRQRLPSTRSLAKSLGISRSTVTQSYEQLISEGYLETVVGSGTFVCAQLPDDLLQAASVEFCGQRVASLAQISRYAAHVDAMDVPGIVEPDTPINFRYGRPAFDEFPIMLWRKLFARRCQTHRDWLDYSIDPLGYRPLRTAIAHYLSRSRAVQCHPDQILITNGVQQALYLVTRLLLNPGETLAIEEPGYLSARRIFVAQGAKLLPIPVDKSGLVVEELANVATTLVKLVYVTPSHQFPTGAILSLPRRLELLSWAQQTGTLILEDDYDSEYRYGDRPIPALQGLDHHNSVLYMGTFSKVLFPALRLGYLVLPLLLVRLFSRTKWLSDRHLPVLEQQVLTDFIEEGHLERHLRKMRRLYDQRRQALVQALQNYLGEQVTILGERAGIHLMVHFDTALTEDEVICRAAQIGVGLPSARPHYLYPKHTNEFILGYAELAEEKLEEGIRRLAQILAT